MRHKVELADFKPDQPGLVRVERELRHEAMDIGVFEHAAATFAVVAKCLEAPPHSVSALIHASYSSYRLNIPSASIVSTTAHANGGGTALPISLCSAVRCTTSRKEKKSGKPCRRAASCGVIVRHACG